MPKKEDLPNMVDLFTNMFAEEKPTLDALVVYEVLFLEIEHLIQETSDDAVLGKKIRELMNKNK